MECCDESYILRMTQKSVDTFSALMIVSMQLQCTLANLQSWSQKWLLSLNTKKCCVVSYGRSVDKTVIYTLADHSNQEAVLERYDKVKDLYGPWVWFDEKLSFREHIQDKINKAYMMLGIIKRNYDSAITPTLLISDTHKTRGNDLRLQKSRLKYDMR